MDKASERPQAKRRIACYEEIDSRAKRCPPCRTPQTRVSSQAAP